MLVLDGKKTAAEMETQLAVRVADLRSRVPVTPCLATILVGQDPSSKVYVNMKHRACQRVGLDSRKVELPENTTTEELLTEIQKLNQEDSVVGILLQHPVPAHIDERRCFDAISLSKDVDGVTSAGFGQMAMGLPSFVSATPLGIMKLLHAYDIDLAGKLAVVVGRSPILGKPIAQLLLQANATVVCCHSRTRDLSSLIRQADVVVGACGRKEMIRGAWIKEGAVVIDAGYHPGGFGDIELAAVVDKCSAYTPVPGGVGPMTIASLIAQTVAAAEQRWA